MRDYVKRAPRPQTNPAVEAWIAENGVKEAVNSGIVTNIRHEKHKERQRIQYQAWRKKKNPNVSDR